MIQSKDSIRKEALGQRQLLSVNAGELQQLKNHVMSVVPQSASLAAYFAKGRELDPAIVYEELFELDRQVLFPRVVEGSKVLEFAPWDGKAKLEEGAFDIPHPISAAQDPDVVLVPLLAFDRRGHRLGYGGGYYDATLMCLRARKDILAIGIAYATQACLFNLPVEAHDAPLDMVITPTEIHDFRK